MSSTSVKSSRSAEASSRLFSRLDAAMESGDSQTISGTLGGIVDLARSSPLAQLGDLGKIREALEDKNQVWEL